MAAKWDQRYLKLAEEISSWSKDPSRHVGAVAVGSKGQVLAQGYNGFPRGVRDDDARYQDRETKYKLVVHAEMNCIYNATYNGTSLDGATLYVHGLPVCSECAKGIVQVGIKRVIMPLQDVPETWQKSWELTQSIFAEGSVDWEFIDYESSSGGIKPIEQEAKKEQYTGSFKPVDDPLGR